MITCFSGYYFYVTVVIEAFLLSGRIKLAKPLGIRERICKKISNVLAEIVREGKLAKATIRNSGIFIPDNTRSQFISAISEELLVEKEILDAIGTGDLEHIVFDALWLTRNKQNIQDRATFAAKLILSQRKTKKP